VLGEGDGKTMTRRGQFSAVTNLKGKKWCESDSSSVVWWCVCVRPLGQVRIGVAEIRHQIGDSSAGPWPLRNALTNQTPT
jgi:hypothetical protein